jgi:nicotinate phosphoribosyltransferase
VQAAGTRLGAIRLDSGDPREEVPRARALLDQLGATETRIIVTGDLDEYQIAALKHDPVDSYGVGTSLVTGSGHPTAGFVYKLVAVAREPGAGAPLTPVAKRSAGKSTVGGRKWAYRSDDGREVVRGAPNGPGRPLQVPLPAADDVVAARSHCAAALASLDSEARRLEPGTPRHVQPEDA